MPAHKKLTSQPDEVEVITLGYLFARGPVVIVASLAWLVTWFSGIVYGGWSKPIEDSLWSSLGFNTAENIVGVALGIIMAIGTFSLAFGIAWTAHVKAKNLVLLTIIGGGIIFAVLFFFLNILESELYWNF